MVSPVTGHVAVHVSPCCTGSTSNDTTFHSSQGSQETGIYGMELPLVWLLRHYETL